MSRIGFPVRLGAPIDDGRDGEFVGLPALRQTLSNGRLTRKADTPCPFCKEALYVVPQESVVGRIVGSEDGKIAVDPLPHELQAVGCVPCGVTFYQPRTT